MCGILCYINYNKEPNNVSNNELFKEALNELKNRGPEESRIVDITNRSNKRIKLGFVRLAINDLLGGSQPMNFNDVIWVCNGEIYNHKLLRDKFDLHVNSSSDCAILGELWYKCNKNFHNMINLLDGVFSIILYDKKDEFIYVARDRYGVRPLFYSETANSLIFSSEMKAITKYKEFTDIKIFNPSHYLMSYTTFKCVYKYNIYYTPTKRNLYNIENIKTLIRTYLKEAVYKRIFTSERPIGALLSGGLDSSLICALVQHELKQVGKCLETFSIGFQGSPDLKYARLVAEFIGSKHTEIVLSADDFFEAIPSVIKSIETYDITTVRASVGNWLVCKSIKEMSDCKVIFNGDGSDEIFGSYLYFYNAPNNKEFEQESNRLLKDIHMFDVLRSDRSISSHGLEARTPFLDYNFVELVQSIPAKLKRPTIEQKEKWILREAFKGLRILPDEVLDRQKEAFSDGVSSLEKSWYSEIEERVGSVSMLGVYTHLKPISKESQYYRDIFDSIYGRSAEKTVPYFWLPKWSETNDPSARTLKIYSK